MPEHKTLEEAVAPVPVDSDGASAQNESVDTRSSKVPWHMKIIAVVLVSFIGFGSHWSTGVTGAMKSTLKKVSSRTKKSRGEGRHERERRGKKIVSDNTMLYRNSKSTTPSMHSSTAARTSW